MIEEEIKKLFNKYGVKDLKDKNGQSECYFCKNIRHRYSLTWTSFLYEYKEHYYCYDCLLGILLQQENQQLKEDLKQVLDDILKAFENNNCIDWNFTEIRKKYNFDLLKGDKE